MDSDFNDESRNGFYEEVIHNENTKTVRKASKKRFGFFGMIAAILIVALISSFSTGYVMNSHFNSVLDKKLSAIDNSDSSNINTASAALTKSSNTNNVNSVSKLALVKDSSITQIAKAVGPSVIGIRMTVSRSNSWFGRDNGSVSEGSGIIFDKSGYIMTNYHVVSYADPKSGWSSSATLEVFLPDGRQFKAKFIGGDQTTDLAVIKIDAKDLKIAELGDSSKLEVGELAVAIGNPLGMEFAGSVTSGIISALNRTINTEDSSIKVIQTDAAINPGNSGGALVNSQGQVIGINSSKISETGVEGLGFAIPINDAKPIINQLMMFGYVKGRPSLGVDGQDISSILAQVYRIPQGVYVTSVAPGSGAANAGIQEEDIIMSVDGKNVASLKTLDNIIKQHKVGDKIALKVYRDERTMTVNVTLTEES